MSVIHNQRGEMTSYYSRITQLAGAGLFVLVGLGLLLWLEPTVALHLVTFTLLALGVTALALRPREDHSRTRLGTLIADDTSDYLDILSSLAFLSGFLVILYPLVMEHHGNVLAAIIAVMLLRQMLSSMTSMVKDARSLSNQKQMIDTLTSPEHRLRKAAEVEDASLQELFRKERRQDKFLKELTEQGLLDKASRGEMRWLDPTVRDANRFVVSVIGADLSVCHFEQHVYPARVNRPIENEELLFQHVSREEIFAPPIKTRYTYGPFQCMVYEAGLGAPPSGSSWAEVQQTFLMRLSCLQPSKALADAFKSSHLLLGERLHDELVGKMVIAAENADESALLAEFGKQLPALRQELSFLPLCLANPDFRPINVNAREDGGFYVMNWGQWLIEPFGTRFDAGWKDDRLHEFLQQARKHRTDVPASLTVSHIRLVDDCSTLERRLLKGNYRGALDGLNVILDRLSGIQSPARLQLSA